MSIRGVAERGSSIDTCLSYKASSKVSTAVVSLVIEACLRLVVAGFATELSDVFEKPDWETFNGSIASSGFTLRSMSLLRLRASREMKIEVKTVQSRPPLLGTDARCSCSPDLRVSVSTVL